MTTKKPARRRKIRHVDPLRVLYDDLKRAPRYSREEIKCLGRAWRDRGDPQAREALIMAAAAWAVRIAGRYKYSRVDFGDLISMAFEGLVQGIDRYDPDKGAITTFCSWQAARLIRLYLKTDRHAIHIPAYLGDSPKKAKSQNVAAAAAIHRGIMSLAGNQPAFRESIVSHRARDPRQEQDREAQVERLAFVMGALDDLPEPGRTVLQARLGGDTLKVIGRRCGLTRERIRQIETIAINKLRRAARQAGLLEH